MTTNGAKEVLMRPPPKQPAPPKTARVGDLDMPVMNIGGNPYAKVNQRVESAHAKGGYTVISREYKEIFKKQVCEVWIELPNGQRFPGIAELDPTKSKPLHDAETSAIGRALGFAGFDIQTAIASHEEMEDFFKARGQTVVESEPAPNVLHRRIQELGHALHMSEEEYRTFLYSYKNQETGKVALQAAVNALEQMLADKDN